MIGWILGGGLLCLLALLLLPVTLFASYQEETFRLELRYLFFRIPLYPGKEEEPQEESASNTGGGPVGKPKEESSRPSLGELFSMSMELLHSLWPPVRWLLKTMVFHDVFFGMRVCGEDAAQTAIDCGRYNAVVFGICAALKNFFQLKRVKISIFPDFSRQEGEIRFWGSLRLIPLTALLAGIAILCALLVRFLPRFLHKEKEEQPIHSTTNQNKGGVTI